MNLLTMGREIKVEGNQIDERDIKAKVFKGHVCIWFNQSSYISQTYYGEVSPIDSNKELESIVKTINKAFLKYNTERIVDPRVLDDIGLLVDKYRYKKFDGIVYPGTMLANIK